MKTLLRLEEGLLFAGGIYLFTLLGFAMGIRGLYPGNPLWQAAGLIRFSHTAMDRMPGYGLQYEKGFIFTHLGTLGLKRKPHA
jgi:hypothetical protein